LGSQEFTQGEKENIKKGNHQVVVVTWSSHASKKGLGATSASTGGRCKENFQFGIDDELEFDSSKYEYEETEKLLKFDKFISKGG